ncbi:FIG00553957: hypothetical protein [Cronobacter condimenti 1330]|uniref:Peptidylprolyl isomerase n=2 Tax=Cronobacter condimenti 1330 TaxID=1073999 RepID=K8AFB3_9ENTR|nr:hypothetical protein [Cronobacter condimenti]CCJ72942.1 FIG00553957: hypothetical protein [Cronobacter condimenti 1330]
MKGRIQSHKRTLCILIMLALSGPSSWAAQNSQGNDFLSSIQQIEVKQMDFPAPTRRAQTPSASRAQINDLQQEIARLKKQIKAAEQEKKSLGTSSDLNAQNMQLLKDNSALAKENDRLTESLQNARREQGATATQQAARIEVLEKKTAQLQAALTSKTAELAQLNKASESRSVSESALQKQITRLEQEKAALAEKNTQSTARFNSDMQALRNELNKRADELLALKTAGDKRAQHESALQKQLAELAQEKATLAEQNARNVDALNQKAQALQAELDKRATELAALKQAGAEHSQNQSALEKQLKELAQEKATLAEQNARKVDALNQKAQALQAELDKRATELAVLKQAGAEHSQNQSALQKQLAELAQEKATLAQENRLLQQQTSTLSKKDQEKLQKTQAEQTALLQKNQAAQEALKAQIVALTEKLNASSTLAATTQEKAAALETELARVKASQSEQTQQLQTQQQQAAQLSTARTALNKQLTDAQAEITTLKQSLSDKETRLQQSDKTLQALKEEAQSAKALNTIPTTDQQKALAELKRANEELNTKLTNLSTESAAQKAQAEKEKAELLAQTEKLKADALAQSQTPAAMEVSAASLKDKASKQSYANGVMFSRLVQKSMDQMADLGIKTNLPVLMTGIKDGLAQKVVIEPKALLSLHDALLKELSGREEKKYEAGINQLEKITAQKKLLKRNKSLFFIQTKAGKKAISPGDTVNVSFKEETLEGRVLNNNANVPVTYDENLPYIFQQALELGKRGGVMEVYCFAGDLYNPDTMPPQLFNYSLMKLTVTISAGK